MHDLHDNWPSGGPGGGQNTPAGSASPEPLRVMLVGRTALDPVLRRDPGFELFRPTCATDAIGELAEAIRPGDRRGTLVLVSEGAVESARSASFASALRRIDAGAVVVSIGAAAGGAGGAGVTQGRGAVPAGFDGALPASASPEDVRRWARRGEPAIDEHLHGTERAERAARERSGAVAATASTTASATAIPTSSGLANGVHIEAAPRASTLAPERSPLTPDERPVREVKHTCGPAVPSVPNVHERTPLGAVLAGKDPAEAALASVRALLGPNVRYIPSVNGDVETPLSPATPAGGGTPGHNHGQTTHVAPVAYGGKTYGHLVGEGVPSDALAKEAAWMGGWAALAAQQEQLRRAAFTDELTGAWNRRYFQRFLGAAVEQAKQMRRTLALLVFDIDNFKQYNDQYGHGAGDEILMETVRLLKAVIRPSDRVCRVGGDEFAVIFYDPEGPRKPGTPQAVSGLQSAAEIARRFQQQVCEHRFPKLGDQAPGRLSISGGLATYPWDGQTPDQLVQRADELAMTSKRQGKNFITFGPGCERPGDTQV